jgi:hypothetical protein
MNHLTTLNELRGHITLLASVEESETPFVSCYLNLEDGEAAYREALDARASTLRRVLKGDELMDFEESLVRIEAYLANEVLPEAKGVAIFARGTFGGTFMLPMQFAVPLPNWIAVYPSPNIYHLVELKDNYHRYVVMHATAQRVRILEVNLGAVTMQVWKDQPQLRERVEREWARTRYQLNRRHRGGRFLEEQIAVLQRLMRAGGHTHLILAGDPQITGRIRHALPKELAARLVDTIPAGGSEREADVVAATLSSFIEYEEQESEAVAERLIQGLHSHDLALTGALACLQALQRDHVDTLVMARDYRPDPGWHCTACGTLGTEAPETLRCPRCGEESVRPLDIKETLVRLAGQAGRPVEVVEFADELMALGGVGCLLRFRHKQADTA